MTPSFNKEVHQRLRNKVRQVYAEVPARGVYFNSRGALKFTYKTPHGIKESHLDPITSAVVINALVPKSGVILRGGHGGGKTTLIEKVAHMLTGIPEEDITSAMIRGNDDQNVNTLLSTFKLGKLLTTGEEDVLWRNFVTCYVKIIDELNRFPPPAQNALFEILNRGRCEFSDHVYPIHDFMAFATENPNDAGTYPLSKPLVDRFSFCVPIPQLASAVDQHLMAERPDDKLIEVKVDPLMTLDELVEARRRVSLDVKMGSEALLYSIYLTQALSTCERADYYDKSHNEIPVGERCKGCGFETERAVCMMTQTGPSGRAFLDFQRWGKAYAWFLNAFEDEEHPEVPLEVIQTIAPYLLYQRLEPTEMRLAKSPFFGMRLRFLEEVVARATEGYLMVRNELNIVPKILHGEVSPKEAAIESIDKDLVVKYHFKPLIEEADKDEFRQLYAFIEAHEMAAEEFGQLRMKVLLESGLKLPAKSYLLSMALAKQEHSEYL